MLKEIIKKYNKKIIFSTYGILTLVTMILPFVILGMGIYLIVKNLQSGESVTSSVLILAISIFFFFYTFKRTKEFFVFFKYVKDPESFPYYQSIKEQLGDLTEIDRELTQADVLNAIDKNNPLIITESLIVGYSKFSFFIMLKENLIWAYEYNGNGLVMFDKYKKYGYVVYPTVDGNDVAIAKLEEECPYAYFGLDFDYKKVMHDEIDETIEEVQNRVLKYKENPGEYREKVLEEIKNRDEIKRKELEEEKNKRLEEIEKREKETNLIKKEDSIKESEDILSEDKTE